VPGQAESALNFEVARHLPLYKMSNMKSLNQTREASMKTPSERPRAAYLAGALAAVSLAAGAAGAAEWSVDKAMSSVGFVAEQQGTKFNGRFETFDATIDFDPSSPVEGSITGTVVTESVNTRDHDRDAALTDRDWFNSAEYAEATFESESVEKLDDGSFRAAGQLTIKGTSKAANLDFTLDASGGSAKFEGKIMVDRFDFNVGEGWNDTSWVGQNVEVTVSLALTQ
jgi:polyisoprenoid-binding protein YceI